MRSHGSVAETGLLARTAFLDITDERAACVSEPERLGQRLIDFLDVHAEPSSSHGPVLDELRRHGICVLSRGAIEDYYPLAANRSGPKPDCALSAAALVTDRAAALALSALAALALAFAKPLRSVAVPIEGSSVMLVTDHSGSMSATDVEPNRLQATIEAAKSFLSSTPRQTRVGIVTYSDAPDGTQAPTTDRTPVRQALQSQVAVGATATGSGAGTEFWCRQIRRTMPDVELIAGGGVRTWEDVERLGAAGADAVLVASALHDGTITLPRPVPSAPRP